MHQRALTLKNKAGMNNLSGPGISCSAENGSNGFQIKLTRKSRPKVHSHAWQECMGPFQPTL